MSTRILLLLTFLLASCAHTTTESSTPAAREISSDQKSTPNESRLPDQVSTVQNEPTDEVSEPGNTGGTPRKINIPANQAEIADKCEKQFTDLPETYKNSVSSFPINHRAIKISYNMKYRIPNWVYYNLSRDNLMNSCGKRKDKFKGDPVLVAAGIPKDLIITDTGYKNSGFDRGHMAPSGDFIWDQEINEQTFYMTNMSPQTAELNQKTWNKLEERVRDWACGFGELKVYTGPIIEPNLKRLNSCVSIPNKFFKVLLASKNKKLYGIGFIYDQNDRVGDPYKQKAVSIRKVEEMSGLNFFKDDYATKVQDEFETQFDIKDWEGSEENCYGCDGVLKQKF
jgi:endonuclease G